MAPRPKLGTSPRRLDPATSQKPASRNTAKLVAIRMPERDTVRAAGVRGDVGGASFETFSAARRAMAISA